MFESIHCVTVGTYLPWSLYFNFTTPRYPQRTKLKKLRQLVFSWTINNIFVIQLFLSTKIIDKSLQTKLWGSENLLNHFAKNSLIFFCIFYSLKKPRLIVISNYINNFFTLIIFLIYQFAIRSGKAVASIKRYVVIKIYWSKIWQYILVIV